MLCDNSQNEAQYYRGHLGLEGILQIYTTQSRRLAKYRSPSFKAQLLLWLQTKGAIYNNDLIQQLMELRLDDVE